MTSTPRTRRDLNWWLIRACAALIAWDLLHLALSIAAVPRFIARASTLTIIAYQIGKNSGVSNETFLANATARGMSPAQFAIYQSIVAVAFAVVVMAIGLIVLSRARGRWFVWLTAHIMLFLAPFALYQMSQVALLVPKFWIEIGSVSWPLFVLYFFLFPNGRAVPRWLLWPLIAYALFHLFVQLYVPVVVALPAIEPRLNWWLGTVGVLQVAINVLLPFILGAQIYRYFWVSSPSERLQTKAFLFGFAAFIATTVVNETLNGDAANSAAFANEIGLLAMLFLPLSIAVAILRFRLWDVDQVIRRTLVYGLVTALLALVFYGIVLLTQRLFAGATGQQSPVALVVSTLAIAALFSPLRRRVQDFVDRRFYRRRYDSEQVLARFGATARDETDLEGLSAALAAAVGDTMQPATVGMWLDDQEGRR
jgi:hypothetical protein